MISKINFQKEDLNKNGFGDKINLFIFKLLNKGGSPNEIIERSIKRQKFLKKIINLV